MSSGDWRQELQSPQTLVVLATHADSDTCREFHPSNITISKLIAGNIKKKLLATWFCSQKRQWQADSMLVYFFVLFRCTSLCSSESENLFFLLNNHNFCSQNRHWQADSMLVYFFVLFRV
ncbi:hypothetical protein J6590_011687 [Homalodisca vitripennis]|nr:hypothetical protein J6590_011687 [Homalodisca vitripennis]